MCFCHFRNSVTATTELVKKADSKPAVVRHGVHHLRKINHDDPLVDVVYNSTTEVLYLMHFWKQKTESHKLR